MNYLVCRGEEEKKILLDEISILIIENQQICITSALISELMNHKIRVIFCDNRHYPQGELEPYCGNFDSRRKLIQQLNWSRQRCDGVWKSIIKQKIYNQKVCLKLRNKSEDVINILNEYMKEVVDGDSLNREGLAAKIYFPALFGKCFERHSIQDVENSFLDYGYSLLMSMISNEISIYGYNNSFGIHHNNDRNHYNLACDFIEPFRPFVDFLVTNGKFTEDNFKKEILALFNMEVSCDGKKMFLSNAVKDYVLNLFNFLNKDDQINVIEITFLNEQL